MHSSRSVDMVLTKIKVLLQNGTMTIQDRLVEIQEQLDEMKRDKEKEVLLFCNFHL